MFPHHEAEIAQNTACCGNQVVRYWVHNNMVTINGQKMGKSLGNFITLDEFFTGQHQLLTQAYHPMTIRFFILQAHYRSTLDFSNEALQSAEKALNRLMDAYEKISKLSAKEGASENPTVGSLRKSCYDAMNDDMNTAIVVANLFEASTLINSAFDGKIDLCESDIQELKSVFDVFLFDILGMMNRQKENSRAFEGAIELLLKVRAEAKSNKDWATSDKIRDELTRLGFEIKDGKNGTEWKLN